MSTKIYLVRHGETEWNKLGKFQGCTDINLSSEGIVQATHIKNRFNGNFDYIYTSPLKRAMDTAKIISMGKNINPVVIDEIREINFGDWEGLTIRDIAANYPKEFKIFRNDEFEAPICGGDLSIKNACLRAKDAILKVASENKDKTSIIVAHGGIIKAGLIGIFDWKMTMYHRIILGNTSVCEVIFNKDMEPTLMTLNDTSHLPKALDIRPYV